MNCILCSTLPDGIHRLEGRRILKAFPMYCTCIHLRSRLRSGNLCEILVCLCYSMYRYRYRIRSCWNRSYYDRVQVPCQQVDHTPVYSAYASIAKHWSSLSSEAVGMCMDLLQAEFEKLSGFVVWTKSEFMILQHNTINVLDVMPS